MSNSGGVISDLNSQEHGLGEEDGDAIASVFGLEDAPTFLDATGGPRRKEFRPWHHPVKQIVREKQWAGLTRRLLLDDRDAAGREVLRYFTLPGPDLLDVRVIADAVADLSTAIEYLGFDSTAVDADGAHVAMPATAESALVQSSRITRGSRVFSDRLEDIADSRSQAANNLAMQGSFDVINIDGCDHLGYSPPRRQGSTFDAIQALLLHQLTFRKPWLLFVTTRAHPQHLSEIGLRLQQPIMNNLIHHGETFGPALAACIGGQLSNITAELTAAWSVAGLRFLKIFAVGYGKHLIQWFLGQMSLPATVELKSAYGYRVHGEAPDMLSLAFRIVPLPVRAQPPSTGGIGAVPTAVMEPRDATALTARAARLWDLDDALTTDAAVRAASVEGTRRLLHSANYDLAEWTRWLVNHRARPMTAEDIGAV